MNDLSRLLTDFVDANTPSEPPPPLAARGGRRVRAYVAVGAAAVLVVAGAVGGVWWARSDPARSNDVEVLGEGGSADYFPSTTPADWVTYADHVLLVTVTSDEEGLVEEEGEAGSAVGLIHRTVTARVDQVLWSRPDPDRPAPSEPRWETAGWIDDGDVDDRTPIVVAGRSRVEPGHSYVVALAWREARCSPGDGRIPAQWVPLGGAAVVPVDDGIVGAGEFEGEDRTVQEARDAVPLDGPVRSVRDLLTGEDVTRVPAVLNDATAGRPKAFDRLAPCD